MLNVTDLPHDPGVQAMLFYGCASDSPRPREHLVAHGIAVGPIGYPGHMPGREMRLADPDGDVILIGRRETSG